VINAIRAHLAEFGIVAPVGRMGVEQLLNVVADPVDKRLPDVARECVAALGVQLKTLKERMKTYPWNGCGWPSRLSGTAGNQPAASNRRQAVHSGTRPLQGILPRTQHIALRAQVRHLRTGRDVGSSCRPLPVS